jgi:hypothetical protein
MAMSGYLANVAFKEWISLKMDWSEWILNEQKLDKIDKSKVRAGNWIYISKVVNMS